MKKDVSETAHIPSKVQDGPPKDESTGSETSIRSSLYYEWVLEGAGSVVAMCWLSCPSACGILVPNQGSNLICLHWKVDSPPLDHHGRLYHYFSSLPITVVVSGFLVNTLIFLNSSFRRIEQREHRVPIYSLSP